MQSEYQHLKQNKYMQEINHELYQAFVKEYYDNNNKCTSNIIAKAILQSKNKGIIITLKNGDEYTLTVTKVTK